MPQVITKDSPLWLLGTWMIPSLSWTLVAPHIPSSQLPSHSLLGLCIHTMVFSKDARTILCRFLSSFSGYFPSNLNSETSSSLSLLELWFLSSQLSNTVLYYFQLLSLLHSLECISQRKVKGMIGLTLFVSFFIRDHYPVPPIVWTALCLKMADSLILPIF